MIKRAAVLVVLFFFNLLFLANLRAQEARIIKRNMTNSEFTRFKNLTGTYEEGKNYNQIIDGHGTGLIPPTEEEWEKMRIQPLIADKIEFPLKAQNAPSSFDNSSSIWFPPIGNQDGEGSCASWASGYYVKTFQEAKEHNWDLSGCLWEGGYYGHPSTAYQDKIFSPDFIYHQVNNGRDNGSTHMDNMNLLQSIGCCTWGKMSYDPIDHTSWPHESAWREAPWFRSLTGFTFMDVTTDQGIEDLKQYLAEGNIVVISVNANYYYSNFAAGDLWTLDNYYPAGTNHANTIVGYDDNYGPFTESGNSGKYGAFKVANSWGIGGWETEADGFYYISYECLKQRIQYVYLYQNYINYVPQMLAVFEISHSMRGENKIDFGIGDPDDPYNNKSFNNFALNGGSVPFPDNPMILDISEFIPDMINSDHLYMRDYDGGTSATGTIDSFYIEKYDDYASGTPSEVYISPDPPINTLQSNNEYANIFTSSEYIYIKHPSGGETFNVGSKPAITYSSKGTSGYINLAYSTDGGITWIPIAENIPDIGQYANWIVPDIPSDKCKIMISDADGNPSTISSGLFTIDNSIFTEQALISLMHVYQGSVAWGDYNNDGNIDILLTGYSPDYDSPVSKIYENNGDGTFSETSIPLVKVSGGSVAWGDYDNNGYLDILMTGSCPEIGSDVSKIYKNNGDETFSEISIPLVNVSGSSVTWGDYDNDGYLDILLTGINHGSNSPVSKIYKNNKDGTFSETSISLVNVWEGSVAWGDYNNDGYLDILLTGLSTEIGSVSKIYKNNGDGTFSQTSIPLANVDEGSAAWGDYNNDGYPDILLTGVCTDILSSVSKIYKNNGDGTFSELSISIPGFYGGPAIWGDYDNDGDPDVLLAGYCSGISSPVSGIYKNNGDDTFSHQSQISLTGVESGSAGWGDYDNDGDLDIVLTGFHSTSSTISKIYRNNSYIQNSLPSGPSNLKAAINGNDVTFIWDKSSDNETPQNGLTYNMVIGTSPGSCDILSPMSDLSNGKRRIVAMGNTGHCNFKIIKGLPDGKYYWSVQAVDNNYAGSNFAAEESFTIQKKITPEITQQPESQAVLEGETISFKVEAACDGPLGFQWWKTEGGQWNNGDKDGRLIIENTENSSTLTITNVDSAEDNNNEFLCEVKNLDGYPEDDYWINTNTVTLAFASIFSSTKPAILSTPILFNNDPGDGHEIIMNFTSLTGNGNVTVNQINRVPQNSPCTDVCEHSWELSKDIEITSFTTNITFQYTDADVAGYNETPSYLGIAKFNSSTNSWQWLGGNIDAINNTVTVNGVSSFSTFALFRRIFGDCNGDGYVDAADLQKLGDCWHSTNSGEFQNGCDARFFNYNKNSDGNGNQIIDAADLQVFGDCWHNGNK